LRIPVAVAVAGLAWAGASQIASAQIVGTTVNLGVGHSTKVQLGSGASFAVASCTSAAPSTVACGLEANKHGADDVQIWCLGPTGVGGDSATVAYLANGINLPFPSTTLTVNCAAAPVPNIRVGSSRVSQGLQRATGVTACTTNVAGAPCTFSGNRITRACQPQVALNTLPILVTATVTLSGASVINGKTVDVYFTCI